MQKRASEATPAKAVAPPKAPEATAEPSSGGTSIKERMAAMQKRASEKSVTIDAPPPPDKAPPSGGSSIKDRMAAMQKRASSEGTGLGAPPDDDGLPKPSGSRQSGGIKARLAAMGGGVPMMGMPGMAMPGMGGPPPMPGARPASLARSKSMPDKPAGPLTHATMARAKAPKRRPKTASFDPKKLGDEFANLEAIDLDRPRSTSALNRSDSEPAPRTSDAEPNDKPGTDL